MEENQCNIPAQHPNEGKADTLRCECKEDTVERFQRRSLVPLMQAELLHVLLGSNGLHVITLQISDYRKIVTVAPYITCEIRLKLHLPGIGDYIHFHTRYKAIAVTCNCA